MSLLLVALTVITAVTWLPINDAAITRADDAGWDQSMLLPHWMLLWLSVVGAVIVSAALLAINLVICVAAFRAPRAVSDNAVAAVVDGPSAD